MSDSTEELLRALALDRRGGLTAVLEQARSRTDLVPAVARLLRDDNADVRAMGLLALTGVPSAVGAADLARQAVADRSAKVRVLAVRLLGGAGALPDLAPALEDPDPAVVAEATRVLTASGPAPDLIRGLLTSPDETQRRVGAELATEPGDVAAVLRDPSPRVRSAAVATLTRLGSAVDLGALIADEDATVRATALRAVQDPAAARPLLADPDPAVRALAVDVLIRLGTPACTDVVALLTDPDAAVRAAAVAAAGAWRCAEAVPLLERAATEGGEQAQAITALAEFGPLPDALLLRLLADPDPVVRTLAAKAAARSTDRQVRDALGRLVLTDPSATVRRTAAPAAAPADAARAARTDPDARVRLAALAACTDPAVGVEALGDGDSRVRAAAARWLGRLGGWQDALSGRYETEEDDEVRAELHLAINGPELDAPARPLFDPAGRGSASTTWLKDLDFFPVSEGVVFYNTGVLREMDDDDDERYTYEVRAGRVRILRDGTVEREIPFTVDGLRLTLGDEIYHTTAR